MIFSSTVPLNYSRQMLLSDYLAKRFTYFDQDEWRRRIIAGKIALNGSLVTGNEPIAPGDIVSYDAGEFEEPPADLSYRIIFEDDWMIGVDKPGNLLMHRAGKSFRNNLIYQLRVNHSPPFPESHPVHRLDRETSGVVVVAKSSEVMAEFGKKFNEGGIEKVYLAIVHGNPKVGEVDLPIGKKPDSGISFRFCIDPAGKKCRTRIVASKPLNRDFSLVTVQPLSGRTHQIRVHLAAVGNPIAGDQLYGFPVAPAPIQSDYADRPFFHRQALHCFSLSFMHPFTGNQCRIEAPMHDDMQNFIEKFSHD